MSNELPFESPKRTFVTPDTVPDLENKVVCKIIRYGERRGNTANTYTYIHDPDNSEGEEQIPIQALFNEDNEPPKQPTEEPASPSIEDHDDYDDDFLAVTMSTYSKGALATLIGNATPDNNPKLSTVQKDRHKLSTILSTIEDDRLDGGLSWIVEEHRMHMKRIGATDIKNDDGSITKFELPEYPEKPKYVRSTDCAVQNLYNMDLAYYKNVMFWSQEVIGWVQKRYPKGLVDKEIEHNVLPLNFTAREAFKHIETKVKSEDVAQLEFEDIMKKHLDMKYKPNANGAEEYFKYAVKLQDEINRLDIGLALPNTHIMACAMSDFKRSGHDKTNVAKIIMDWKGRTIADDEDEFKEFQAHFNRELKQLYRNGNTGVKHVANQALESKLTAIEERQAEQDENMLQLHDNQRHVAARAEGAPGMPPVAKLVSEIIRQLGPDTKVNTSTDEAPDVDATARRVVELLRQNNVAAAAAAPVGLPQPSTSSTTAAQNGTSQQTGNRGRSETNPGWRQWKYWCHTCGCNLHHNSDACPPKKQRPGHVASATKDNPQGGNAKKDRLWMLWCHPSGRTAHKAINGERVYVG